eukprot:gene2342-8640_t
MKMLQTATVAAALMMVLQVLLVAGQDVSPECLDAGNALTGACSAEISAASEFFGVDVGADVTSLDASGVDTSQLDGFLATATVSGGKQTKAPTFNDLKCSCEEAVLGLISGFTGGDIGVYKKLAKSFSEKCGFTLYIDGTC